MLWFGCRQAQAKKLKGGDVNASFHPLSSKEIEDATARILPKFDGVLLKSDVKSMPKSSCVIINIDDVDASGSPEHGGTHWVAYCDGAYFDSFGGPPITELKGKVKVFNSTVYQNPTDVSCGYWALMFLKLMNELHDFPKVMARMSQVTPTDLLKLV